MNYVELPPSKINRITNSFYTYKEQIVFWDGKYLKCEHERIRSKCKECGGASICEHDKIRSQCKQCGGASICEHGRQRSQCKECGGSSLCKSSWCEKYAISKYDNYCLTCCIHLRPDIEVSRNYKTKENEVIQRIKDNFPDFDFLCDRRIEDGCSLRRPDCLLDLGSHIIITEVDENKHDSYDCSCENKRLMEISQDLQHRPIIFIRFNPDDYIDQNGKTIKSCWKLNKLGVMKIVKVREWEKRIKSLIDTINYWIHNPSPKTIEIIELFY